MQDEPGARAESKVPAVKAFVMGCCPRCRKGRLFKYPFWNPARFYIQEDSCSHCGQDFVIEPGFYYGSMYVTYAVNVAVILSGLLFMWFGVGFDEPFLSGIPVIGLVLLLVPLNFRLSRVVWLWMLGPAAYDPRAGSAEISSLSPDGNSFRNSGTDGDHPTS